MASSTWGATGKLSTWNLSWDQISIGSRVDVVIQPVCLGTDGGLGALFPCGTRIRVTGISDLPEGTDAISVFGALVEGLQPMPVFRCDEISLCMHFPVIKPDDFRCITEVCAGIGVATYGFIKAGIRPVAANELRPTLAEMFRQLHEGVPVTVGDIAQPEVVHDLWLQHGRSTLLFGGFACQPFSRGGQQQGALDQRSNTLGSTLRAGLMLRSPVILLECVPEAANNAHVRQELAKFCHDCRFHMAETFLSLEDCWVSRRSRWWVVLTAQMMGKVHLLAPPTFPYPNKILHMLPKWLSLSQQELDQLMLTPDEYRRFIQFVPNLHSLTLNLHGKAPTALHSWGSQTVKCSCGCRAEGFSDQLLSQRGIYGVLIACEGTIEIDGAHLPVWRHIHPIELGLLTCVPVPTKWPGDLRLGVCGLGQQATPLQSLWMSCMILNHVDRLSEGTTTVQAWTLMEELRHEVLTLSQALLAQGSAGHLFGDFSSHVLPVGKSEPKMDMGLTLDDMPVPNHEVLSVHAPWRNVTHEHDRLSFTRVDFHANHPYVIALQNSGTTVQELIDAEIALHLLAVHIVVCDCETGDVLSMGEVVNGRAVHLIITNQTEHGDYEYDEEIAPTMPIESNDDSHQHELSEVVRNDSLATEEVELKMGQEQPFTGVCLSESDHAQLVATFDESSVCNDPLAQLSPEELLQVAPPNISSLFVVESLGKQEIPLNTRLRILDNQDHSWSDDEIRFHIGHILQQLTRQDIGFVDPLMAAEIVRRPQASLLHQWVAAWQGSLSRVVTVVWIDGHWIPLCCTWTSELLQVSSWDNVEPQPRALSQFCDLLSKAVGASTFMLRVEHRRFPVDKHCGVCAVRFIDNHLRGRMLPTDASEVMQLHLKGRAIFISALLKKHFVPRPWLWGNGLEHAARTRLIDLLKQHGVPEQQLETRIHLIVQALGVAPLQTVLVSGNPWRSLKSLANAHKPPIQLVLAEELQQQVSQKMKQGSIGKKTARKKQKTGPEPPPALDPLKLAVDAGVFVKADGSSLRQLSLAQIGPLTEGIVISNLSSAGAYLRADQVVNKLALGLLLVDVEEKDLPSRLPWQQIKVALRCAANGEPMLVVAVLVQLGEQEVIQSRGKPVHDSEVASVSCLKAAIYRDSIDTNWETFCRSPVRYLLGHLPPLQVCEQCGDMPAEDCPYWHKNSDEDVSDPVLDVWRRQWLSLHFHGVTQEEASIFIVNLRYLHQLEDQVLRLSGKAGIYLEPRSIDSRESHLDYQVIWMPRINPAEMERLCCTNPLAVGVARLGSRYGLRVLTKNASVLGQQVKPGSIFLAGGARSDYEVGPLPFGFDRVSLSKVFMTIGWQARPLHTIRTLPGLNGAMWLVQACVDPPETVIAMKHGDVVITKCKNKTNGLSEQTASVVTSSATLELCQLKESEGTVAGSRTDPWLIKDPWTQPMMKLSTGSDQSNIALKQVEERVEQTLLAKIPQLQSGADLPQLTQAQQKNEDRFQAIESQIQQLTQGQQQLGGRVEEQGRKHEAQLSQFQHQVAAQMEAQSSQMESLFRQQMASIEDLLTSSRRSRSRHE